MSTFFQVNKRKPAQRTVVGKMPLKGTMPRPQSLVTPASTDVMYTDPDHLEATMRLQQEMILQQQQQRSHQQQQQKRTPAVFQPPPPPQFRPLPSQETRLGTIGNGRSKYGRMERDILPDARHETSYSKRERKKYAKKEE